MAHKLYQKLISAMADEGVCNASDVDISASLNNQSYSKVSAIITAIISFISDLRETLSNLVSTGLKREIVQVLPTENPSETTIYLILKDPAGTSGDIYDEYMYINNAWEHIGSTEVDLSNYVQKPSNTSDGKQYVMRNGQWEEVQIATDAANITYSGDVTGADNVKAAIDALVPDATIARQLKEAIGSEVGEQATATIVNGSIVFHDGRFYRLTNDVYEGDRWGIEIGAVSTTLSDEINALRGVSSESVYLTIQPTSAIPQAGVTAHIYNIKTQTYMAEETILPSANRVHLGDVPFGDDYTIIMPSIDGYIQPADMTFKAGQMIRERTVKYVPVSTSTVEALTIRASTSNSHAIGAYNAIVSLYDSTGNITQTINVSIEGGTSEAVNIPLGTKYSVQYPAISGYITPKTQYFTSRVSKRICYGTYVALVSSDFLLVSYDGQDVKYASMDDETALQEAVAEGHIFGIAFVSSTLLSNNGAFIYPFNTSIYSKSGSYWSKEAAVDAPSALNSYDGQMNSASALDAILQYEAVNETTITSIFKIADSIVTGFEDSGVAIKAFIPARYQGDALIRNRTALNNILSRIGAGKTIEEVNPFGCSEQISASTFGRFINGANYSSTPKTTSIMFFKIVLPLLTSNSTEE